MVLLSLCGAAAYSVTVFAIDYGMPFLFWDGTYNWSLIYRVVSI